MSHNKEKKIAVINDFCGFGRCSLTVSIPIISASKIQCCPIPTSIFSNHTGFDSYFSTDCTDFMERYIAEWRKLGLRFSGILTGYLGSFAQIEIVKGFIKDFKDEGTVVIVDPVMGDNGALYPNFPKELAYGLKDLVSFADILTPNLTEACILTGIPYNENISDSELLEISEKLSAMGPEKIVISGLERGGNLLNYIYERGKAPIIYEEHKISTSRAGTGDVFASIIASDSALEKPFTEAVKHASGFVAKLLRKTEELGLPDTDGLPIEQFLDEI